MLLASSCLLLVLKSRESSLELVYSLVCNSSVTLSLFYHNEAGNGTSVTPNEDDFTSIKSGVHSFVEETV